MSRIIVSAAILLVTIPSAYAEVWMVKPSGAVGCRDRDLVRTLDIKDQHLAAGCVRLYAGERLLEPSNAGGGFADYIEVQRADSSTVFVPSSMLAADPGIGSVEEDRPE